MDGRNAMSLGIVLPALLDSLGLEFDERLFCSTDVTTLFLEELEESGRISSTAKQYLKENRISTAKAAEKPFQQRTVSLMTPSLPAANFSALSSSSRTRGSTAWKNTW